MKRLFFGLVVASAAHAIECKKPDCFNDSMTLMRKAKKQGVCNSEVSMLFDALQYNTTLKNREPLYALESCLNYAKAARKADRLMAGRIKRLNAIMGLAR